MVGLGRWGNNLYRALGKVEEAEVVAVCDTNRDAVAKVQASNRDVIAYSSLDSLLANPDVDAVVIATPPKTHEELALISLRTGRHVFVEKPAFLSSDMAEIEAEVNGLGVAGRRLTFMVGHTYLYNDLVLWLKEYLDSGKMGRPLYALGSWLNWGTVRSDVNAFWNFAQHPLSILSYLLDCCPHDILIMDRARLQPGVADVSLVSARFGPVVTQFALSWLCPVKTRSMMLVGEKQTALLDDMSKELRITEGDSTVREYNSFGQFQLIRRAGATSIPLVEYKEPLVNEMEHFVRCCLSGEGPRTGLMHALEITKAMERARFTP